MTLNLPVEIYQIDGKWIVTLDAEIMRLTYYGSNRDVTIAKTILTALAIHDCVLKGIIQ
jgi:hypothetical protein